MERPYSGYAELIGYELIDKAKDFARLQTADRAAGTSTAWASPWRVLATLDRYRDRLCAWPLPMVGPHAEGGDLSMMRPVHGSGQAW